MKVAEVFGYDVSDHSEAAWQARLNKHCRFRDSPCTKSSATEPLGVCSLSDGASAASLCPTRFLENKRIFVDAAKIAFGNESKFGIFPEIRILDIPPAMVGGRSRKIGKVDFLLGRIESEKVTDFAAVEIQAAYFSGGSLRRVFDHFMSTHDLTGIDTRRRPDFRSCAQKRLVPQLQLKVPVFRRWGKKFFVVVDAEFFKSLPAFPATTQSNSELTWLAYPIASTGSGYALQDPKIVHSEWDEVQNSLREGKPPEPSEIVSELQSKLDGPPKRKPYILTCNT